MESILALIVLAILPGGWARCILAVVVAILLVLATISAALDREFVATVIFRLHLERMPNDEMRNAFLDRMTAEAAAASPTFLLDYQRLNLQARRPQRA